MVFKLSLVLVPTELDSGTSGPGPTEPGRGVAGSSSVSEFVAFWVEEKVVFGGDMI